jgi:hypothetical protein
VINTFWGEDQPVPERKTEAVDQQKDKIGRRVQAQNGFILAVVGK